MERPDPSRPVEHDSPVDFEATLRRLEAAITGAGLTIFARIDHAAGAREVGLEMRPATVLVYGHPKGGTPIMRAAPLAALELPLRVLIQEREDGRTAIAFHAVVTALAVAGVPAELARRLEPAQRLLLEALA